MALSAAERQRRRYARNPERVRGLATAWYRAHSEECRAKRQAPKVRAHRALYMRMYRLVKRIVLAQFVPRLSLRERETR